RLGAGSCRLGLGLAGGGLPLLELRTSCGGLLTQAARLHPVALLLLLAGGHHDGRDDGQHDERDDDPDQPLRHGELLRVTATSSSYPAGGHGKRMSRVKERCVMPAARSALTSASATRSSAAGCQSPARTFACTCSGRVAP